MLKRLALLSLALLGACAPRPPSTFEMKWRAEKDFDKFADGPTCRVSVWGRWSDMTFAYQNAGMIYPVVELRGDKVLVGAESVPIGSAVHQFQMPVGDIQMKVDSNKSWTIAAINTPKVAPAGTSQDVASQRLANMPSPSPYMDPKAMAEMTKNMMGVYGAGMSPITATTGEEARDILKQMAEGKTLLFRQINGNAAGRTFEYSLSSFNEALAMCGATAAWQR